MIALAAVVRRTLIELVMAVMDETFLKGRFVRRAFRGGAFDAATVRVKRRGCRAIHNKVERNRLGTRLSWNEIGYVVRWVTR